MRLPGIPREGPIFRIFSKDAITADAAFQQPLLMIAGTKADSLYMGEEAIAKATGTKDKDEAVLQQWRSALPSACIWPKARYRCRWTSVVPGDGW